MLTNLLEQLIAAKKTNPAELAALLHISKDTIYKRLHGASAFTLDEAFILQQAFGFSIDGLAPTLGTTQKVFNTKEFLLLDTRIATSRNYVQQLLIDFTQLGTLGAPHLYYAAKDLPLFCFFSSELLTSFKLFFWYITIFDAHEKKLIYSTTWLPLEVLQMASQLYTIYNHVPSTEIWNKETIQSTLHQIEYCVTVGLLTNVDALKIIAEINTFIDTLEDKADQGYKMPNATFTLYLNEILLLDNTVLFTIGNHKLFYLPYQTLNFVSTSDAVFTQNTFNWFTKQIAKSTTISGAGQKARTQLMNHYRQEIEKVRAKL
jgi:hypothetical protein